MNQGTCVSFAQPTHFTFQINSLMKNAYRLLLTLFAAATTLSSCSRADYAFKSNTPAYHNSRHVASEAVSPTPAATLAEPATTAALPQIAAAPKAKAARVAAATRQQASAPKATAAAKPTFLQRAVLKKAAKQLAKIQVRKQNTAEATAPASKLGRAAIVAGAGLLLLLLGGAAEVGIIALIGLIAFIVGLVLVIVALVSGE